MKIIKSEPTKKEMDSVLKEDYTTDIHILMSPRLKDKLETYLRLKTNRMTKSQWVRSMIETLDVSDAGNY